MKAQQLKNTGVEFSSLNPCQAIHKPVTPTPEGSASSSDFCWHHIHITHTLWGPGMVAYTCYCGTHEDEEEED